MALEMKEALGRGGADYSGVAPAPLIMRWRVLRLIKSSVIIVSFVASFLAII